MNSFGILALGFFTLVGLSSLAAAEIKPEAPSKSGPAATADKPKSTIISGTIKVRSQIHISVPITDAASPSDELKAMEASRNDLYDISGRECVTLQETFGTDCHLTGMAIDSAVTNRAPGHSIELSVANSYELSPKP